MSFTISFVSATNTTLTFAWSGLAQPTNHLLLDLNDGTPEFDVGFNRPASGTYTTPGGLASSTTYNDCYFFNVGVAYTNTLNGIQTLNNDFRYNLKYTLEDNNQSSIQFTYPFTSGTFPTDLIQVLLEDNTNAFDAVGQFDANDSSKFVVGNPFGPGTQIKYATFFSFKISQVSATARTIVFAWSGLAQPTNNLNLYIDDSFFVNIGTDLPVSGQYTAFGLDRDTTYADCYFINGIFGQGGMRSTSIYASTTLNNQFAYNVKFSPSGSSTTQIGFDPVDGYPSGTNIYMAIYSGSASATVIGGFDDDEYAFAINTGYTNPFGSSVDYVIFPAQFFAYGVPLTCNDGLLHSINFYPVVIGYPGITLNVLLEDNSDPPNFTQTVGYFTDSADAYVDNNPYDDSVRFATFTPLLPSRWKLVQTLTPSHVAISSALSADGSTIISGSGIESEEGVSSFPACIFRLIDGQFQEVTTIPPSSQGYFGEEVAVDARGQVFGISCTNGNITQDPDLLSGLDSKLVTFDLRSSVDVQGNLALGGYVAFTDGTVQSTAYTKPTANVYASSPTISSLTIDMSSSNSYIHCHCNGQLSLSVSNPTPAKQIQLFAYWGGGGSNYITTGGGWNTIATTGTNPYYVTKQFCVVTVTSMDYTISNVFMVIGN